MQVLVDRDVAKIYGVETKRINEAVKNNIDKFPNSYMFELENMEQNELVENFDRFNKLKHSIQNSKVFTEKGLYMLATILKSKKATQTTFEIIETFAKFKNLSKNLNSLVDSKKEDKENLIQKSSKLFNEILTSSLEKIESETTIELNLALVKVKHHIKKK